jgi:uncharacterized protein
MNSESNKSLMQNIFSDLAKGNDQSFLEAMAEEMKWTWMGSGNLAKTFDGKKAVLDGLWSSVRTTLVPPYKVFAQHFIADDDHVVVEAVGENITSDGKKYNNKYCWVCRIIDGKIHELREYMDTQLVTETF